MEEEKNIIKAISETIKNAINDENDFTLPLVSMQSNSFTSKEINLEYLKDIELYNNSSTPPCNKSISLKLLKRFAHKDFSEFWLESIVEYFPAISEGTMKISETIYSHDKAIQYAKELISSFSIKELAKDFLYGVAHGELKYTTALASYYYIKNLPKHQFKKKYVGSIIGKNGEFEDRYNKTRCEICGYQHSISKEPKMQFWHINIDMANFYFNGRMERSSLNTAIIFLEEYKKLPRPIHSITDYEHFKKIIEVIEKTPQNLTSGKLKRELKQSGLLKMTLDQIENFINTLGYLDILHPEDSHGMLYFHTLEKDMLLPLSDRGYAEHPVNRWIRKCGIDYKSISILFEGIYN